MDSSINDALLAMEEASGPIEKEGSFNILLEALWEYNRTRAHAQEIYESLSQISGNSKAHPPSIQQAMDTAAEPPYNMVSQNATLSHNIHTKRNEENIHLPQSSEGKIGEATGASRGSLSLNPTPSHDSIAIDGEKLRNARAPIIADEDGAKYDHERALVPSAGVPVSRIADSTLSPTAPTAFNPNIHFSLGQQVVHTGGYSHDLVPKRSFRNTVSNGYGGLHPIKEEHPLSSNARNVSQQPNKRWSLKHAFVSTSRAHADGVTLPSPTDPHELRAQIPNKRWSLRSLLSAKALTTSTGHMEDVVWPPIAYSYKPEDQSSDKCKPLKGRLSSKTLSTSTVQAKSAFTSGRTGSTASGDFSCTLYSTNKYRTENKDAIIHQKYM